MKEYIEEAEEVSYDEKVGESYDKEWALKDEGRRESREQIAISMIKRNMDITIISEITGLSIEEINKLSD